MRTFLKITLTVFLTCFSIAYVSWLIPAESTGPAAQQGPIGESPEDLIKAGEVVFNGPDACHVCHALDPGVPNKRCPTNMKEVYLRATRRAEEIQKQRDPSMTPIKYLVESVYNPNAYVVPDKELGGPFSKGVMKPINGPPLALDDQQIKAALAFLISQSTPLDARLVQEINVAQAPFKSGKALASVEQEPELKLPEGDPGEGGSAFKDMKCYQCHKIEGEEFPVAEADVGGVGPDLSNIGGIQTSLYIAESILNPNAVIVAGEGYKDDGGLSKMPEYHDTMTLRQLTDMVAFLMTQKGKK